MNRGGLRVTAILMLILFPAIATAADFREGFGGISWGAPIEDFPELQKVGSKELVEYYFNPGKRFIFEDVEIQKVHYGFYKGRFFAAYLQIETLEIFQQLKQKIQSRFGVPLVRYAAEGQPAVYRWKEKDLKIKLKIDDAMHNMKLALYYVPLTDQVNEAGQERYQEQGFRFLPIQPDRTPEMIPLLEF